MKTFAVLALDQNDPFWSCEAAPLPRMNRQRRIAKADMIIPTRTGHRRVHIVESEYECEAYDAGFAVPVEETDGCTVHILQGEGEISTIKPDPNTNLICTKTLIPVAVYHIKKGKNVLETEFCY